MLEAGMHVIHQRADAPAAPCLLPPHMQALEGGFPLEGKRVLVHAGAGGVGSYCVQVGASA